MKVDNAVLEAQLKAVYAGELTTFVDGRAPAAATRAAQMASNAPASTAQNMLQNPAMIQNLLHRGADDVSDVNNPVIAMMQHITQNSAMSQAAAQMLGGAASMSAQGTGSRMSEMMQNPTSSTINSLQHVVERLVHSVE